MESIQRKYIYKSIIKEFNKLEVQLISKDIAELKVLKNEYQ